MIGVSHLIPIFIDQSDARNTGNFNRGDERPRGGEWGAGHYLGSTWYQFETCFSSNFELDESILKF